MKPATGNHPDRERLTAFGLGRLSMDESVWIEKHLDECEECNETLVNLADDTFAGIVRSLADSPEDRLHDEVSVDTVPDVKSGANAPEGERTDGIAENQDGKSAAMILQRSGQSVEIPVELLDHPRYRIVELIGRGGMGNVYRAEHKLMNRPVALKLINSELIKHPQAVERFRREVRAAAQLAHPNIVIAYDAEQAGVIHFLAMEFVEGTDLASVIQQRGALPAAEACNCIRQAAEGLQHAHEKGMVHRDIKPHNLMLSPDGQIRILDFGLAGFATESALAEIDSGSGADGDTTPLHLTTFGSLMGTPDYIAPEQARDAHSADIRADIYSLGCTLYCLLKGNAPFAAHSVVDKLKAHAEQKPPALDELREDVPAELAAIVTRMMAKDPAERFQTPEDVAVALAPFCRHHPEPTPVKRPPMRRKILAACAAAIIALLASVIFVVTDNGTFEIKSEFDDIEIVVSKGGEEFTVIDLATDSRVQRLPSGEYKVSLRGRSDLELNKRGFTLKRWDTEAVIVTLKPAAPQATNEITLVDSLRGHSSAGIRRHCLAASADGRFLLSCGGPVALYWDIANRRLVRTLSGSTADVAVVALSADGKHAAGVTAIGEVYLWNLETGKPTYVRSVPNKRSAGIAFSPDSRLLVTASNQGQAFAWNVQTGEEVARHDTGEYWWDCLVLADNETVAIALGSQVKFWNLKSGKVETKVTYSSAVNCTALAISADNRTLLVGTKWFKGAVELEMGVHVWDTAQWRELQRCDGLTAAVSSVEFLPGDRYIIAGGEDGRIIIWDRETGHEVARKEGLGHLANAVIPLADGLHAVSFGGLYVDKANDPTEGDFGIRIWRLPDRVCQPVAGLTDYDRLQGRWTCVEGVMGKKPLTLDQLATVSLRFEHDQVELAGLGSETFRLSYALRQFREPKWIEFINPDQTADELSIAGIYAFDGDTLRIAFDDADRPRPRDFTPTDQRDHFVGTFRRGMGNPRQQASTRASAGLLTSPPSVPPGGLPLGTNLIVDPSLENTSTGELPDGWFAWLDDGPNFKCEIVEGGVTGKHCLQISGTGTRGVVFATSIPLDRTKRYALKGRVKVEGEAGTWAVVKLNYFNNTGWLGVDDRVGATTSDLDWKLFEKTDFADRYPTATLIVPTCHIEGNGTAWFDDLEVIAYDRESLPANFDATHGKNNRMK